MILYCPKCEKRALYRTEEFDECQECGYYWATTPDKPERTVHGDEAEN